MELNYKARERVREHYNIIYKNYKERLVGVFLIGSQNYNLDIETSDVDTIAVVIPAVSEFIYLVPPVSSTLELPNGEHIVIKDIRLMRREIMKGSPNILEILFTDYYVINPIWKWDFSKVVANRERIARISPKGVVDAWVGIARRHIRKYNEDRDNFTVKDAITILRAGEFLKNYSNGEATYKEALVPKCAGALRAVRRNNSKVELLFYNVDLAISIIEGDKKVKEMNINACTILDETIEKMLRRAIDEELAQ